MGLTLDAVREAIADAGLALEEIDGVATYSGKTALFLGFSPVGSDELIEVLELKTNWHVGAGEMTAQFVMRHMRHYGLTREQLAQIALNDHANAACNPRAIV